MYKYAIQIFTKIVLSNCRFNNSLNIVCNEGVMRMLKNGVNGVNKPLSICRIKKKN